MLGLGQMVPLIVSASLYSRQSVVGRRSGSSSDIGRAPVDVVDVGLDLSDPGLYGISVAIAGLQDD